MDAYYATGLDYSYYHGFIYSSFLLMIVRVNITAVISVTVALLAMRFRVHEHFYNDILESSFSAHAPFHPKIIVAQQNS